MYWSFHPWQMVWWAVGQCVDLSHLEPQTTIYRYICIELTAFKHFSSGAIAHERQVLETNFECSFVAETCVLSV